MLAKAARAESGLHPAVELVRRGLRLHKDNPELVALLGLYEAELRQTSVGLFERIKPKSLSTPADDNDAAKPVCRVVPDAIPVILATVPTAGPIDAEVVSSKLPTD